MIKKNTPKRTTRFASCHKGLVNVEQEKPKPAFSFAVPGEAMSSFTFTPNTPAASLFGVEPSALKTGIPRE